MSKFLKSSIFFSLGLLIVISLGLILPNNQAQKSVDYSLLQKHQLLKKPQTNRLILTGGSNVLFGINSEILSDSLNKITINHAIHAGYGLKYILDDLGRFIKNGDIIIVAPEYSHFLKNNYLGKEPLLFSLTVIPNNLSLISLEQFSAVAEYIPKYSMNRMKSYLSNVLLNTVTTPSKPQNYTQYAVNTYGDHIAHWEKVAQPYNNYVFTGELNLNALEHLKSFEREVNRSGARLLLTFPSVTHEIYQLNKEKIQLIEKSFNTFDFAVIGVPKMFAYEKELFFDSPYHLNKNGAEKRSNQLSNELKKLLND